MPYGIASECGTSLNQPRNTGVRRRVLSTAIPLALLHSLLLVAIHFHLAHGVWLAALSVVAGSAMVGLLACIVPLALALRDDEFQRALLLESMAWGIAVTMAITTVWGYVHLFADGPAFQSIYTFLLFGYATGFINLYLRRRHRSGDREP